MIVDQRFADTKFVIEATNFEIYTLWYLYQDEVSWEEDHNGLCVEVGTFAAFPVMVSFTFAMINNKRICFYEAVSQVVNRQLIERWLDENCAPGGAIGRRRATRGNATAWTTTLP